MNSILDQFDEEERQAAEARRKQQQQIMLELDAMERGEARRSQSPRGQVETAVSDLGNMTGNYPESLLEYGKTVGEGAIEMITNPVGVAKEALDLGAAAMEFGGRKFEEFATGEEIPPSKPEVEAPIRDLEDYYKSKYGTLDMARESFVDDPVGSTADIFPFLGQRFGAAATARKVASGPTGKLGDRLYRHAAGIPKSDPTGLDLARESARKGVVISEGGLNREARRMREALGNDIEELIKNRVETGGTGVRDDLAIVPRTVILNHMDDLIEKYRGTYDADVTVPFLQKEKVRLMTIFGNKGMIGLEDLQKYKTATYKAAYEAEAAGPKPEVETLGPKTEAQRATARAAKERLQDDIDGYRELNKEFETYARIIPFAKKAIDKSPDQYLGKMMRATLDNPNFVSRLGIYMRKAADGDFGFLEKHLNSPEIRTVLYLVGEHGAPEETPTIPVWGGKQ